MTHRVIQIRDFKDSVFALRLDRNGLSFTPGQYVSVGTQDRKEKREYTVYSSPEEHYLELLIKDVAGGDLSGRLHRSQIGEELDVKGPFGTLTIPEGRRNGKFLFIATGTGIAPFHCFVNSYPDLDYLVLHGVQNPNQLYDYESFDPKRHVDCLSRSKQGRFHGRVTDYLRQNPVSPETYCYLCGSSGMIYEVFEILQNQGVSRDHLFTEVYF